MKVMELDVIELLDLLMSRHIDGILHLTVLELKLWAGRLSLTGTGFLDQGPLISLSFTSPNGNVIVFTVVYSVRHA